MSLTSKGEDSYFIYDTAGFMNRTDILETSASKDDLSLGIDAMPASQSFSFSSPVKDCPQRSGFLVFLDLVGKLTGDVRNLNKVILDQQKTNDFLMQENCKLKVENEVLKKTVTKVVEKNPPSTLPQASTTDSKTSQNYLKTIQYF